MCGRDEGITKLETNVISAATFCVLMVFFFFLFFSERRQSTLFRIFQQGRVQRLWGTLGKGQEGRVLSSSAGSPPPHSLLSPRPHLLQGAVQQRSAYNRISLFFLNVASARFHHACVSPKEDQGCLMSPSCLKSQGRHLIPLYSLHFTISCSSA